MALSAMTVECERFIYLFTRFACSSKALFHALLLPCGEITYGVSTFTGVSV